MPVSRKNRRTRRQRNYRRLNGGSAQAAVVNVPVVTGYVTQNVADLAPVMGGGSVTGYVTQNVNALTPVMGGGAVTGCVPQNVNALTPFSGGRRKKRGGAALLDDIAIPALFLTANQIYGSRRSNNKKRIRFSRKVR